MSDTDEGTIEQATEHDDAPTMPSVADRMAELRSEALDEVEHACKAKDDTTMQLAIRQAKLAHACTVALDAGIDLDTVANKAHVSPSTVRKWASEAAGAEG